MYPYLLKKGNRQVHASTSDFRQYDVDKTFAEFIYKIGQQVPVYFKCDEAGRARELLSDIAIRKEEFNLFRIESRANHNKEVSNRDTLGQSSPEAQSQAPILTNLPKLAPYSGLIQEKQSIMDEFHEQLNGPKKPTTAQKSNLYQRLHVAKQQLEPARSEPSKKSPPMLSHFFQQQPTLTLALPTREQIKSMGQEQLEKHKKEIQEKFDPVGKSGLKGLERNRHYATLGHIESQLKLLNEHTLFSLISLRGPHFLNIVNFSGTSCRSP